jgi:hypothetical protein
MNMWNVCAASAAFVLTFAVLALSVGVSYSIDESDVQKKLGPKQYGRFELEKMGVKLTTETMRVTLREDSFRAKTTIRLKNTWINVEEEVAMTGGIRMVQEGGGWGEKKIFLDTSEIESDRIPKSISTIASNAIREKMKVTPVYVISPLLSKLIRDVKIKGGNIQVRLGFNW